MLITGESGTGKELIAEAIHENSERKDRPFIKVNLGGISLSLFESEMFGHKKGAFTDAHYDRKGRFELADGGSIFLDEIGDLDMVSQVKLLRVLQDHTFESLGDSRYADYLCAQPQPAADGTAGRVPGRPLLQDQPHHGANAGTARAKGRHSAAGGVFCQVASSAERSGTGRNLG